MRLNVIMIVLVMEVEVYRLFAQLASEPAGDDVKAPAKVSSWRKVPSS